MNTQPHTHIEDFFKAVRCTLWSVLVKTRQPVVLLLCLFVQISIMIIFVPIIRGDTLSVRVHAHTHTYIQRERFNIYWNSQSVLSLFSTSFGGHAELRSEVFCVFQKGLVEFIYLFWPWEHLFVPIFGVSFSSVYFGLKDFCMSEKDESSIIDSLFIITFIGGLVYFTNFEITIISIILRTSYSSAKPVHLNCCIWTSSSIINIGWFSKTWLRNIRYWPMMGLQRWSPANIGT